ncbi:hypothetical protein [Christiangramia sp.]|nr:hypothetical protein [Christiangramia sp.]
MSLKKDGNFEPVVFNLHSDLKIKLKIEAAKNKKSVTAYLTDLIKHNLK